MLTRKVLNTVRQALASQASVALMGPRQVGKTTLALQIGEEQNALYLDLEDIQEREKLSNAAHNQGSLINASRLAAGLEVSSQTVSRYTDLLVDLLLVRRLQPYHVNVGKRLVKSPKVYIRDSGLLHALLNIGDRNALLGHPVVGASWEGFVIENLINAAPALTVPGFYRTSGGAGIDLLLELPGGDRWAIEVKRSHVAKPARGFYEACEDLKPAKRFVVHAGLERYPISADVEAIGVRELADTLSQLST